MNMKQDKMVLDYLIMHPEGITPLKALNEFGIFRLSARILDLRKEGYMIKTDYITKDGKTYANYKLIQNTEDGQIRLA